MNNRDKTEKKRTSAYKTITKDLTPFTGVLRQEKDCNTQRILEEMIAGKILNLTKDINVPIQEYEQTLNG